jgi:ATP-binding cassette subfamily B protein
MTEAPTTTPATMTTGERKGGAFNGLLWRLVRESIPQHRALYSAAVLAMILVAGSTALTAWIMGEIVDAMNDPGNRRRIILVSVGVAAIFFLRGVATFVQGVLMAKAGNRIVARKQVQIYRKLLAHGAAFFSETGSSDILVRVTQSAQMARNVIDIVVTGYVRDFLTLIGLVAIMIYQQPVLSIISALIGPLVVWGVQRILVRVRKVASQEIGGLAEIIRIVSETTTGVRVVKSFALEEIMAKRMEETVRQVEKRSNRIVRLQSATAPLMDTIAGLAIAGVVLLSAFSIFGQSAGTPGQLMSFVTAFIMAYEPAKRLSRMRVTIETGMVGVRMMYDVLDQPVTLTEAPDAQDLPSGPAGVRFEAVRFGYADGRPIFDGLSIDFAQGTTTALVGPSGGGKSTILNLILRLYDPEGGSVSIGGIDLRRATFASLRRTVAYVGQETFLFSGSVAANLRLARPDATDEELYEAARIANADAFIRALPLGYDTPVGENGTSLSGGQRQRLAIARAVLRNAPVLLLDEATSALDSHSEAEVRKALDRITRNVTTIVVAHRLSTILSADRICYIEAGRVVESGPAGELLSRDGPFRRLYDRQFGDAGG